MTQVAGGGPRIKGLSSTGDYYNRLYNKLRMALGLVAVMFGFMVLTANCKVSAMYMLGISSRSNNNTIGNINSGGRGIIIY